MNLKASFLASGLTRQHGNTKRFPKHAPKVGRSQELCNISQQLCWEKCYTSPRLATNRMTSNLEGAAVSITPAPKQLHTRTRLHAHTHTCAHAHSCTHSHLYTHTHTHTHIHHITSYEYSAQCLNLCAHARWRDRIDLWAERKFDITEVWRS